MAVYFETTYVDRHYYSVEIPPICKRCGPLENILRWTYQCLTQATTKSNHMRNNDNCKVCCFHRLTDSVRVRAIGMQAVLVTRRPLLALKFLNKKRFHYIFNYYAFGSVKGSLTSWMIQPMHAIRNSQNCNAHHALDACLPTPQHWPL